MPESEQASSERDCSSEVKSAKAAPKINTAFLRALLSLKLNNFVSGEVNNLLFNMVPCQLNKNY